MTDSVSTDRLAEVLGVYRSAILKLFPPLNPKAARLRFAHSTINKKLADPNVAIGFAKPPTIEALLAGELTLFRAGDAVLLSPYSRDTLVGSSIPRLQLTRRIIRYDAAGVVRATQLQKGFTTTQTSHIFGLGDTRHSWKMIECNLVKPGLLKAAKSQIDKRVLIVPPDSVAEVLEQLELLPPWINANDWIDYRLATFGTCNAELWDMPTTAQVLGVDVEAVAALLTDGQLDYIFYIFDNKKHSITPDSVQRYLEQGPIPPGAPRTLLYKGGERPMLA